MHLRLINCNHFNLGLSKLRRLLLQYKFILPTSKLVSDAGNKKMKVLYDFEAVEDNELSFKTGDIITILDDRLDHLSLASSIEI